jgi:hypothetical protein
VAFDLYLSGWFGEGEPASHYAVKILRSLKVAAVGSKPVSAWPLLPVPSVNGCWLTRKPIPNPKVVFVVHSFGGLIVKEILRLAEQDPKARRLLQNTVGVGTAANPRPSFFVLDHSSSFLPSSFVFRCL